MQQTKTIVRKVSKLTPFCMKYDINGLINSLSEQLIGIGKSWCSFTIGKIRQKRMY